MNFRLLVALVWGIVMLFQENASGQSFCGNTGGFNITPAQGCAPLTVTVENLVPKAENVNYAFRFNRNSTSAPSLNETTQESSYTYTTPGTYTILQFGSAGGTGFSQCKDVVVHETRAPKAEIISCPNGKVRLTFVEDTILTAYDAIQISWGDGSKQNVDLKTGTLVYQHTYSQSSNLPAVRLRGIYADGKCQQNTSVTTLSGNSGPPALKEIRIRSVEMSKTGEARLIYDGLEDTPTEIWIDKGNGQFEPTGKGGQAGGPQAATIAGLDPKAIYRFKLVSRDICENLVDSPIVSTLTGKEGPLSLDEIISVTWEHQPNTDQIEQFQVMRNGAVVFSTPDELSFLDTDVKCGNTYKYQVVAIIANDVRSYSAPFSLEPKSASPENVSRASVTVQDDQSAATVVELSGEGLTSTYNLIIERALLGSADFQKVSPDGNQSLQYVDTGINTTENSYCYRFRYENACKLASPDYSPPVCTILLTNRAPDIVWTSDAPFTEAVDSYDVQQVNEDGTVRDAIPVQQATSYAIDLVSQSEYAYRIQAKTGNGAYTSFSNVLRFNNDPILLIPDAFTPNGDAYNERFEVKAYFIKEFKMSVFDRWGTVIYHTNSTSDSWDGRVNEQNAKGGYYIYRIEATDNLGRPVVKNGSFLLIR